MRIGIQGQYDLYTSFNAREAVDRIPKAEPQAVDKVEEVAKSAEAGEETGAQGVPARPNGDIGEIAMRLKTADGFGLVDKIYSDIEKDESLKQYQYFVGTGEVIDSSDDGIVIQKSGFDYF
ncbi:MAG: hypothetical protein K5857_10500 [Lachnospiraceae bacterium]|nr:hypothetical protein [Lachnospiraceae bacterium]